MNERIRLRAESRTGPEVTESKAAAIVAAGGQVYAVGVTTDGALLHGLEARVQPDFHYRLTRKGPKNINVNWVSTASNTPWQSQDHADCVSVASKIGKIAHEMADPFASPAPWVKTRLAGLDWDEESMTASAARRYSYGDINTSQAWLHAVREIEKAGEL